MSCFTSLNLLQFCSTRSYRTSQQICYVKEKADEIWLNIFLLASTLIIDDLRKSFVLRDWQKGDIYVFCFLFKQKTKIEAKQEKVNIIITAIIIIIIIKKHK